MNTLYLPILGYYDKKNDNLSIVIISLIDKIIKINDNEIQLLKNDVVSTKINLNNNKFLFIDNNEIKLDIDDDVEKRIKIFNCDCHFVPETGIWNKINNDKPFYSFHLGDQIYNDLIFFKHCRIYNSIDKINENIDKIKTDIFNNYLIAYKRKESVLQHSFNIFLGDDHEIVDDSIIKNLDPLVSGNLRQIYREVFQKIKTGLYNKNLLSLDNKSILLFDNIDTYNYLEYSQKLIDLINENKKDFINDDLYIMSPRVLLNFKSDLIQTLIFQTDTNNNDYDELYDTIFSLNKKVKIFCGDRHYISKYNIILREKEKKISLYLVGPMNSIVEPRFSNYNLLDNNLELENEYQHLQHGYISIEDKEITQNRYTCWLNKLFGPLIFAVKYLNARYLSK